MHRKHLFALAAILNNKRGDIPEIPYAELVRDLSYLLAQVNPAFSETKFREACYAEIKPTMQTVKEASNSN